MAQRMNLCVSLVDTLAKETCQDIAAAALLPDFCARYELEQVHSLKDNEIHPAGSLNDEKPVIC